MADEQKRMDGETEELRDILLAISVVAKRLATKLENRQLQEEANECKKQE